MPKSLQLRQEGEDKGGFEGRNQECKVREERPLEKPCPLPTTTTTTKVLLSQFAASLACF